jgi:hypothetical protein
MLRQVARVLAVRVHEEDFGVLADDPPECDPPAVGRVDRERVDASFAGNLRGPAGVGVGDVDLVEIGIVLTSAVDDALAVGRPVRVDGRGAVIRQLA